MLVKCFILYKRVKVHLKTGNIEILSGNCFSNFEMNF